MPSHCNIWSSLPTDLHRTDVLFHWATWPYLITCLSGLQSVNGLSTWGTTIIKSLGFSSIRANLLNAPGSLLSAIFGIGLSAIVDRYNRFGYPILFAGSWTLAGLIALYVSVSSPLQLNIKHFELDYRLIITRQSLPVQSESSWSFYAAYLITQAAP